MIADIKKYIKPKNVLWSFIGLLLLSLALAGWNVVNRGFDPIGAVAWVVSDFVTDGNMEMRGWGSTGFMMATVIAQLVIYIIKRKRFDWYSIVMQLLYAGLIGFMINFTIQLFNGQIVSFIDYNGIRNLFASNDALNEVWLTINYTFWLVVLIIGAAIILKANVLLSAMEKLTMIIYEVYGKHIGKTRLLIDIGLSLFVLGFATLTGLGVLNYFNYCSIIATIGAGPLFAFILKRITWL